MLSIKICKTEIYGYSLAHRYVFTYMKNKYVYRKFAHQVWRLKWKPSGQRHIKVLINNLPAPRRHVYNNHILLLSFFSVSDTSKKAFSRIAMVWASISWALFTGSNSLSLLFSSLREWFSIAYFATLGWCSICDMEKLRDIYLQTWPF